MTAGNYEEFVSFFTDDALWIFVGNQTLSGKDAVRQYMEAAYLEQPKFKVENLIVENDFVTALDQISFKHQDGYMVDYSYCDIWRFRDGKMNEFKAFVI